jgi:hypothetical protein
MELESGVAPDGARLASFGCRVSRSAAVLSKPDRVDDWSLCHCSVRVVTRENFQGHCERNVPRGAYQECSRRPSMTMRIPVSASGTRKREALLFRSLIGRESGESRIPDGAKQPCALVDKAKPDASCGCRRGCVFMMEEATEHGGHLGLSCLVPPGQGSAGAVPKSPQRIWAPPAPFRALLWSSRSAHGFASPLELAS